MPTLEIHKSTSKHFTLSSSSKSLTNMSKSKVCHALSSSCQLKSSGNKNLDKDQRVYGGKQDDEFTSAVESPSTSSTNRNTAPSPKYFPCDEAPFYFPPVNARGDGSNGTPCPHFWCIVPHNLSFHCQNFRGPLVLPHSMHKMPCH